ncbi:hypothetical protein BY458DRAFT_525046 [Sporodiniella umbellata]|nr:hypothetical protein BY458DRAFT_525046 [Sporodiniella umbellata]
MYFFQILVFLCLCLQSWAQVVAPPASSPQASPAASSAASPAASSGPAVSASVGGSSVLPVNGSVSVGNTTSSTASVDLAASNSIANLPTSASFGNTVYGASATFLAPTASKSVSPLFRIDSSQNVTFSWSFTNLLVRPTNLTLAAVGPNKVTYTITALNGAATSATWALSNVPAATPLMMGMYQVQLYDQRGISAPYAPGWLSPVTSLTIAFYSAESYASPTGADYCPTCFYSAARRMSAPLGPIAIAFAIASLSSLFIIYGLMYQ